MIARYEQEQMRAFEDMLEGKPFRTRQLVGIAARALLDPFRMIMQHMPGAAGYGMRSIAYRRIFQHLGRHCILDVGLRVNGGKNISVDEYTWIDAYAKLFGLFGPIIIGKRVHLAPFSSISAGPQGVTIGDYASVATGAHIYGHTNLAKDGKRLSGVMIPWRYKAYKQGPVVLEKDSGVAEYSIVLPGVTLGEGALIGPHSVVYGDIPPWTIAMGNPARVIAHREKVSVSDL
jgi:acetyltransferase-like isoleucine patch superfamily enzyme